MRQLNEQDKARQRRMMRRILDISYKHKLSHIGSCLTALPIIDEIYSIKRVDDPFILSSGHAGLALYAVLEEYEKKDAEVLFEKYGVHPNQDMENGIYCSTGSLGQGLPIAVGAALSNLQQNVYCLISDGEAAEGSMYEAINVINKYNIENIKIYVNFNGWGAYDHIAKLNLPECKAVKIIYTSMEFPFLKGQDAHYHVMTEDEYKLGLSLI